MSELRTTNSAPHFRSLRAKSRSAGAGALVSRLRSKRTGFFLIGMVLSLAACGGREELQPAQGKSLPPAPYGAEAQPTPTQLITPSVQARPERSDELLRRSEERRDDRFDLPPS
jgi:hypothetical protein